MLGLAASGPAAALFNDHVEVWAAENITHDSNVFRLSDKLGPGSVGAAQLSDTVYTTHLGITAGIELSQQRLEAAYTWYDSRYRYFKDLDYTGHTVRAAWNWKYDQFSGVASYTEAEGLASFANIQAREKDLVLSRIADFRGQWRMTPRWLPNARLTATQTEHDNRLRRVNDIEAVAAELGLSYVTPLDNTIGALARFERGRSPHGDIPEALQNEYDQGSLGGSVTWNLAGHSRFDGRVEYVRRNYVRFSERDYAGPLFSGIYTWTPTPKTKVSFGAVRQVGPPEDVTTSFVLVTGGYIRPQWEATPKILVQGNLEYNVWDYKGGPTTGDFTHRQRLAGASVQWTPWRRVFIHAGYNREMRTSTLPNGDYDVDVVFIEGRIGF
jgi:exopolysaccharide biosynthesis operon protein EpsL